VQRIFARISPNLPEKFCATFGHKFSVFVCFLQTLGAIFFKSAIFARIFRVLPRFSGILPRISGILLGFSGILPGFLTNQNFWGCVCTPCTPASYTTELAVFQLPRVTKKNF